MSAAAPDRRGGRANANSDAILNSAVLPTLLRFALPIILGNIFQQLYHIVDAIVVGKLLGEVPLAGISVASPIMDVANALLIGGTVGVGVLAARLYGEGNLAALRLTHTTALLGGGAFTVLLSLIGFFGSGALLRAQGTEEAVCAEAAVYLHILFAGLIFCFLYNYYASVLRSVGDSRTPFAILLVSSTLHALLDVLLVGVLDLGIHGVAFSTAFCQFFSALCCMLFTHRRVPTLAISRRADLRFSAETGLTVLRYAWAAALQQAVVCIGRLLIQGMLTPLGTDSVTGYNMGMRTEQMLFCFSQGIGAAMVVCLSQNLGHGNRSRVYRFFRTSLLVQLSVGVALGALCLFCPEQLIRIFSDSESVVEAGAAYTGTMSVFYLLSFLGETIQGFFRGMGRLRLTMIASALQVLIRVILSYFLIPHRGIAGICISVVVGWALLVLIEGVYSLKKSKEFHI